jgi:hypothetical protein
MNGRRNIATGLVLFAIAVLAVVVGNAITAGAQLRHLEQQPPADTAA